jgi:hypothetical protein
MKKVLLLSLVTGILVLLGAGMSGCGSSGTAAFTPTPTPTPPTPTPTPTPSNAINVFTFLRADDGVSSSAVPMAQQQPHAAHHAWKVAHASNQQGAVTADSGPVNIYVWPGWITKEGFFDLGTERKITGTAAAYSSVHLSLNGSSMVYSAQVNGYSQIFTNTVPAEGETAGAPLQLTTDVEQHWLPHLSADGTKVAFTKFDPTSNGDVVCVINNVAESTENCLNFSATTPMLRGANLWHASWAPDGKIFFEAWGGPFRSDEIFSVNPDGSSLTKITNNAGSKNYDECPSVSSDGTAMAVDTWNDTTQYHEVGVIDLNTKQRATITRGTHADAWDPLFSKYTLVWVTGGGSEQSLELWFMSFSPLQLTRNNYPDYFASSSSSR